MISRKTLGSTLVTLALATAAYAQDWSVECIDPANTQPYSLDYGIVFQFNRLFGATALVSGTVTYGGQNGPCFAPSSVNMVQGGTGFAVGQDGSIQDSNPADPNSSFIDDFMVLTFGMPDAPSRRWNKFGLTKNGTRTIFGTAGFTTFFAGESGRYFVVESILDGTRVNERVDVIGDTAKLTWTLTNLNPTDTANLGFWAGHWTAMLSATTDITGSRASHQDVTFGGKLGFVELPGRIPPRTDFRMQRVLDPSNFPTYISFLFGQNAAYGLRLDLGPTENTKDANGNSDATQADELLVSNDVFALNGNDSFGDTLIEDTDFRASTSYIAKYSEIPVGPTQSRKVIQYYRSPWGNGNYSGTYTAVVDAPQLVATDPDGLNELRPNPMTFRVYIDNSQQLATIGQGTEVPLQQVGVRLIFPTGQLALAPGESELKTIASVPARAIRFVDYSVEADGDSFGDLPYRVEVTSTPGGPKTITGVVKVSATPRMDIDVDANLITSPWRTDDTSWEAILGLETPSDFIAYRWDPQQQGYIPVTGAERGFGHWIVSSGDFGVIPLSSNPQVPGDTATGAPLIQLKSGWNLIANPYPFPIKLGQLVGTLQGGSPTLWSQLVSSGLVGSAIVRYDNDADDYVFVQGGDSDLLPHQGYWAFVNTQTDITLKYPPVYARHLPGALLRPTNPWTQTEKMWRLQLSARTDSSQDAQNFVGVVRNAADIRTHRSPEVPMSPIQDVSLAIEGDLDGRVTRMAHAYTDKPGRKSWKVLVKSTQEGDVTLAWPNLSTVPKNLRLRLTDKATGTVKDLRTNGGYTFRANGAGTREFELEIVQAGTSRAVIGNVIATRPGRDNLAPFTIRYTLSSDAQTTVRILSGSGKEVYTVTRGRADRNGENEVTWALRDNANRLVAPGSYRVEILAETATGERVRKVIPVNVIR